jgi:septal ring factor EnvC (AmiA/AmiB activator)
MASPKFAEKVLNKKISELEKKNKKLEEMFALQVKLVTGLELEIADLKSHLDFTKKALQKSQEKQNFLDAQNADLRSLVFSLTQNKLPCKPDHNGECLLCDCWISDCPLKEKSKREHPEK